MAKNWITPAETMDPTGEYTEYAISFASWILFKLTAEKYPGNSQVTECYSLDNDNYEYSAEVVNGQLYNLPRSSLSRGSYKLMLRHSAVTSVSSVSIGGVILDPSEYQLRNRAFIVKTNKTPWNYSSNNEICVTYSHGANPPLAGKMAATRLANELILNAMDSDECALPENITNVSRQGISYTLADTSDFLSSGKTGIPFVDQFIVAANPGFAKKRPKVFSPDRPNGERIN